MGTPPDDYFNFKLALKLGMDPDELDEKPIEKVELWQGFLDLQDKGKKLQENRNNQANG